MGARWHRARRRPDRPVGALRRPGSPEAELCARGGRAPGARAGRPRRAPPGAHRRSGARTRGRASTQQAFGRFFVDLAHAAPGGRRARGDGQPRRRLVHQPRRLDQPRRDLAPRRPHRLVRRRHRHAGALARVTSTASTSSWGSPRATSSGLLGELGVTWSRDGQPLLPIGTLYDPFVNRALEPWSFGMYAGGAVDPRRHAVGGHAGARGRRAPVDHHAVGRPRAAALRRLGAGLRPGPRVGAARTPWRGSGAPDGRSAYFRLTHAAARPGAGRACRTIRRRASAAPRTSLAGGYVLRDAPRAPRRSTLVGVGAIDARGARGGRRAERRPAIASTWSA